MVRPHSPPTALPPYEPPYIPLSAGHLLKLGVLVDGGGRQTTIDKLIGTLALAFDTLGNAASDLGELVPVGKDDHSDEQAANQVLLDDLDAMARSLVDDTHKAAAIKSGLKTVVTAFREDAREAKRRRREAGEDAYDATKIAAEDEGIVGRFEAELRTDIRDYEKLSMVARQEGPLFLYTRADEYVKFRRYLWNAQHPDQANNMPRANTWFTHLEGRRKSQAHLDVEEDSDIEIAQEKQSYACPLTLRPLEHPVTSTLCPHSYEKSAVEDYLKHSGGSAGCPVSGCSQQLTLAHLTPDPVLERDIRRAAQRELRHRQEEEDNSVEDADKDADKNVDSDEDEDMPDVDDEPRKPVKNERGKRLVRAKARVLDIDSDGGEEGSD